MPVEKQMSRAVLKLFSEANMPQTNIEKPAVRLVSPIKPQPTMEISQVEKTCKVW